MTDPNEPSAAPPEKPQPSQAPPSHLPPTFVYVTGFLLLMIISALTGLTLKYYRRAHAYDLQLTQARRRLALVQALGPGQAVRLKSLPFQLKLPRDQLAKVPGTVDGKAATVLEMSAPMGESLGLKPGDLIRVQLKAPNAPASQPADRAGATQPAKP